MTGRLAGLTVLVPESRELDLFAGMLEGEGASTRAAGGPGTSRTTSGAPSSA